MADRRRRGSGNAYQHRGRWYARIPIGSGARHVAALPWCTDEGSALERVDAMAEIVAELRRSPEGLELAPRLLDKVAAATDLATIERCREVARRIVAGETRPTTTSKPTTPRATTVGTGATFEEVARLWTRGDLAKKYPDHVRTKRTAKDDEQRLEQHVFPHLRGVAVSAFTLRHAERVMSALPSALAPATRRQIAQTLHRVLKLAVYPLSLIPHSPIPPGWLPRVPKGAQKKQEVTYPQEHDRFLGCAAVPLEVRLFAGFVAREGMRHEEAESLTWGDLDLEAGLVRLDENKTDDARSWAMRPGTTRALAKLHELREKPKGDALVFLNAAGGPLKLRPDVYREHLKAAGVVRPELHEGGPRSKPTGIHGLRALFVTEALARGESESWVSDRTGHQSSQMIATYKRRARTFREAKMAELAPLDVALGWAVEAPRAVPEDRATRSLIDPRRRLVRLARIARTARITGVAPPGVEPGRPHGQRILNPPRLPFRHGAAGSCLSQLGEARADRSCAGPHSACSDCTRLSLPARARKAASCRERPTNRGFRTASPSQACLRVSRCAGPISCSSPPKPPRRRRAASRGPRPGPRAFAGARRASGGPTPARSSRSAATRTR